MANIITGKIDVTKIDNNHIFVGQKGKYIDIVLIPTPTSKFGEYMIVQRLPKAERDAGKKGAILGNAGNPQARDNAQRASQPESKDEEISF